MTHSDEQEFKKRLEANAREALRSAGIDEGQTVLDYGSGAGAFTIAVDFTRFSRFLFERLGFCPGFYIFAWELFHPGGFIHCDKDSFLERVHIDNFTLTSWCNHSFATSG